ncbi:methyl-accepting chemotaxis protein, partial [Campylobacter sp. B0100352/1]|uniref:PDC sensor domain-containing protein n=1 Tax=Campylobacter sp. B0100352/1 TaxID=2735783 RepID=UPI001DDD9DF2|nr:methyl-accepting chemotaxis protein [Campylobacter sp. B0100352/1]
MRSLKIKFSLITNVISITILIVLGIATYLFVSKLIHEEVLRNEHNYIKMAKNSITFFNEKNLKTLKGYAKNILELPYEKINNQQVLMENIGEELKLLRDAGGFLAVYIAQPNGELIVSDTDSDSKGLDFGIYGKADNYDARTKEYYQEALKTNDVYVTSSYIYATSKLPCFTYSKALYKDGKFIGVLAIDVLTKDLQQEYEANPGRTFAFDKNNKIFAATDKFQLSQEYDASHITIPAKEKADFEPFEYTRKKDGSRGLAMCVKVGENRVCTGQSISKIEEPINKMNYIQIIIISIAIIINFVL